MRLHRWGLTLAFSLALPLSSFGQGDTATSDKTAPPQAVPTATIAQPATIEQVVDKIIDREHEFLKNLGQYRPMVETYIQNVRPDQELGLVPDGDYYYLGRMDMSKSLTQTSYLTPPTRSFFSHFKPNFHKFVGMTFNPSGFSQMAFPDTKDFDRAHYDFQYQRREFLGGVRCLVFDVVPKKGSGNGRFLGRMWVEDEGYNIVRLTGTYAPAAKSAQYFHFDSWRTNVQPDMWVPSYIYTEDADVHSGIKKTTHIKAQTRFWGYDLKHAGRKEEFSTIVVDAPSVKDHSETEQDASPIESQRAFIRQAEDNVVDRMERAGLLAPSGEVDKVMQTVVNNLEITNNLDVNPEVRCRVLLTAPLESFTIGRTIVISRGLLDVLPDEASLATMLAHELAHVVLGHQLDMSYAFNDKMLFNDEQAFNNLKFNRTTEDETAADAKAMEFLKNSPYKDQLAKAGLFLRMLDARKAELPNLIRPHIGDGVANVSAMRLQDIMNSAPELQVNRLDQISALPLGGRLKVSAWDGTVEMKKNKAVVLLSPREKMPFEVTPLFPYLARQPKVEKTQAAPAGPTVTSNSNTLR